MRMSACCLFVWVRVCVRVCVCVHACVCVCLCVCPTTSHNKSRDYVHTRIHIYKNYIHVHTYTKKIIYMYTHTQTISYMYTHTNRIFLTSIHLIFHHKSTNMAQQIHQHDTTNRATNERTCMEYVPTLYTYMYSHTHTNKKILTCTSLIFHYTSSNITRQIM